MPFSYNPLLGVGLDKSIPLDGAGKIPSTFLPSYVDDVEEYNNLAAFPATGETGKIYVAIDTGFVYRWSGSVYVQIGITAANELDDYEEGTWTPSVGGTATYYTQSGTYTKIGNVVTVSGRIHVNIKGTGSGTIVSGLPFTSATSYPYGIAIGRYSNIASSAFTVYGELLASSSLFELFCTTAAGTGNYIASVFADSTQITFTFTYRV